MVAGEGAEGGRRVGRPEGGQADLRRRLAEGVGGDHQAVDVRRLALVGRHAVGGVALDVLDRADALADGEADVLGGDVVLEVDEGLGAWPASRSVGQLALRDAACRGGRRRRRRLGARRREARVAGGRGARRRRRRRGRPRAPEAAAGAGAAARPRSARRAGRSAAPRPRRACPWCGEKRCRLGVQPPHISTRVAGDGRGPAPTCAASATRLTRSEVTRSRPAVPVTVRPSSTSMPRARARSASASVDRGADVDDRRHARRPACGEVEGGEPGRVVGGDDRRRGCRP